MSKTHVDNQNQYQKKVVYGVSVLIAIVSAIVIYLPRLRSLFHPFDCSLDQVSTKTRTNYQATNGFFIDNQVIVIGPKDNVNAVIDKLANPENPDNPDTPRVILILVEGCDLSYLNTRKLEQVTSPSPAQTPQVTVPVPTQTLQVGQLPQGTQTIELTSPSLGQIEKETNSLYTNPNLTAEQRGSLEMRLYEIPPGSGTTESIINRINREGNGVVFADPNYIVSLLDENAGPCGQPYAGGGSPYAGGGSPYAGGGSPTAGPGISGIDVSDQFMQQWAFDERGINLPASSKYKGEGVTVGIFDTSPFRKPYYSTLRTIRIAGEPLSLAPRNAMGPDPISNHGLFVSGLIHAIAPESDIKLIRVLNDNGCGNLWEIDAALHAFSSRTSAWTRRLDKVVINLSLGVHIPDPSHVDESQNASGNQHVDWDQIIDDLDKIHAYSFEATLSSAHDLGAVIVAAAGNDSAPTSENPTLGAQEMQVPASYLDVIGVAATTRSGDRACYSNKGEVAAPGGSGGVKPDDDAQDEESQVESDDNPPGENGEVEPEYDPDELCVSRAVTWDLAPGPGSTDLISTQACNDMASCDFGVMSLLIVPDRSGRWKYDYGLWSGTSFSTAFVSGLAALSFERIGNGSPEQVECLIYRKPVPLRPGDLAGDLGVGIINIEESLTSNSLLSTCRNIP